MDKPVTSKLHRLTLNKKLEIDGKTCKANLSWSVRSNFPRVAVYLSNKDDELLSVMLAPLTYANLGMMTDSIKKIAVESKEQHVDYKCEGMKWVENKPSSETEYKATVRIGKDAEGIMYLAVIAPEKPKIRFALVPKGLKLFDEQVKEFDPKTTSTMFAESYAKTLDTQMSLVKDEVVSYRKNTEFKSSFSDL